MADIPGIDAPEALDAMLAGTPATILAGGHTHIQMLRQHHGRLLVNPGSVGLAFKDLCPRAHTDNLSHAEYAMIEEFDGAIGVNLRRLLLDAQSDTEHPLGPWLRE
jgi:predicted phosphodiesterase